MLGKVLFSVTVAGVMACGCASRSGKTKEQRARPTEAHVSQSEHAVGAPAADPATNQTTAPLVNRNQPVNPPQENSTNSQPAQTVNQGLKGKVVLRQGNFMPSPDAPRQTGENGVAREVYIYELTNVGQVQGQPPFYSTIQTKQVAKVVSDKSGTFAVKLDPGKYSVFVKEAQGFYANLFDGQNNIFPVEVQPNQVTEIEILIDHQATY